MTVLINNAGNKVDIIRILVLAYFLCMMQYSYSAPLGLPDSTAKVGYGVAYAYMSVDDPDGATNDEWAAQVFNPVYTDWLFSDIRQWTEVYYYETSLDADDSHIGQNIESYGLRFSLQKSFRLTSSWSPWLGAGINISHTNYTDRHTKDSEGFLLQRFDDRNTTGVLLLLNFVSEWELLQQWSVAAKLEQSIAIDDDISQFSAMAVVLYRY